MTVVAVVLIGSYIGSFTKITWGWLDSGEPFNFRKFFATFIATVILTAPIAAALMTVTAKLELAGIIGLGVNALLGGWGIDSAMKKLTGK